MFVLISLVLSLGILAAIYHYAKVTEAKVERKYQLVVHLRELVTLIRQHRTATHYQLMFDQKKVKQLEKIEIAMEESCLKLVNVAHFDNKPLYRVLHSNVKLLTRSWKKHSVSKNQIVHGKLIRQTLFLVDEIFMAWLMDVDREELQQEYRNVWQGVIDSLDCLTQLRICIDGADSELGKQRILHYCKQMHRKVNHLSLVGPLSVPSPMYSTTITKIEELISHPETSLDKESLYQLTSELSELIFTTYDGLVSEIASDLYQPVPSIMTV
ncbi:hypothetical protein [Vibrio maritimus]|uniref:Nitrate/nitrite sensing protein domain-containing protein n=1 Tax=Vibrio variabilis TaxID=990271 RepID=A0ABQ0JEI5_9VIBR|nr:hypothetical protein [Vibrio maritimus]GAL27177.1 hypothetical protein JCM19239_5524 [Vibrio variabilis]